MNHRIAFWNILLKDMRTYYLKPPNISWGLIFPLAWTGMFFIKTGGRPEDVLSVLPGVVALSVLFGTTSMLAVTVTFEKRSRSFERLLLAPLPLELLLLAKTAGAVLFGTVNAFVPVLLAAFLADLSGVAWTAMVPAVVLIAVASTFLGLLIAVSVSEVFEAQTFSNFFRFPMIFLCGLFFPLKQLPAFLRPVSYALPLTYGADILHGAFRGGNVMPFPIDFAMLLFFCGILFLVSLRNARRRWIACLRGPGPHSDARRVLTAREEGEALPFQLAVQGREFRTVDLPDDLLVVRQRLDRDQVDDVLRGQPRFPKGFRRADGHSARRLCRVFRAQPERFRKAHEFHELEPQVGGPHSGEDRVRFQGVLAYLGAFPEDAEQGGQIPLRFRVEVFGEGDGIEPCADDRRGVGYYAGHIPDASDKLGKSGEGHLGSQGNQDGIGPKVISDPFENGRNDGRMQGQEDDVAGCRRGIVPGERFDPGNEPPELSQ